MSSSFVSEKQRAENEWTYMDLYSYHLFDAYQLVTLVDTSLANLQIQAPFRVCFFFANPLWTWRGSTTHYSLRISEGSLPSCLCHALDISEKA